MTIKTAIVVNCDDAVLFWGIEKPIKDCWGFAIERERSDAAGGVRRITLDNRTGFAKDHPQSGAHRPSTVWPFQRFWWADHSVNTGDRARYRVTPMIYESGVLHEQIDGQSNWTPWVELSGIVADKWSLYFNRGLVISQFMSRYLEDLRKREGLASRKETLAVFKKSLDEHELPIRRFLGGVLRERMLDLLKEARQKRWHLFGALYELEDDELVGAIEKLGRRAHIVLANGSIEKKKNETSAEARKRDQNSSARARLRKAKAEVFDRFVSPGALGHNKFLVLANRDAKARAVWTGSTNWTKTGLCTQINNGLLVEHAAFAQEYMAQWERLRDAKSEFPKSLIESNSQPKQVSVRKSQAEIWFTRCAKKVDLAAINEVINGAKEGVLFLMFQPGGAGALGTVRTLLKKPGGRYIKGVVSTLPPDSVKDEDEVDVTVHGDESHAVSLDVVQPHGIKTPFASWAATVMREEFLSNVGYAIVHSKVVVVDPFTAPAVITGSHNFSTSASASNDENFVIVRGNRSLALAFGAHILSVYHHYRWLSFVNDMQKKGKNPTAYLRETDAWQVNQLKGANRRELDFWLR